MTTATGAPVSTETGLPSQERRLRRITTLQHERWPNLVWVEVEDEDGATGLGETFSLAESVAAYIHEGAAPYLLGQVGADRARHWTTLHRQRGRSGIGSETRGAAALDIALWDLAARRANLPLFEMLGGRSRDQIRVYNTCAGPDYVRAPAVAGRLYTGEFQRDRYDDLWAFKNEPEKLAESLLKQDIRAMKIWPFDEIAVETGGLLIGADQLTQGLEPIRRIRAAVGMQMDVALEMHLRWSIPAAIKIARAAEEFQPMWMEDVIRLDNLTALDQLCTSTTIPILTGESLGGRFAYHDVLERTHVSIIMSDPVWTGGPSEIRRIADLTATYQRAFTPHDCTGPIGLAVGTHVALYAETAIFQEIVRAFLYGWYEEVAEGLPTVERGYIQPARRPGHGVTLRTDGPARDGWHERTSRKAA
jgi:L-alanine-DL-glutamate epimerase-like enolase superfamily enzyme